MFNLERAYKNFFVSVARFSKSSVFIQGFFIMAVSGDKCQGNKVHESWAKITAFLVMYHLSKAEQNSQLYLEIQTKISATYTKKMYNTKI